MSKKLPLLDKNGQLFKNYGGDLKSINPLKGCTFSCYNGKCWAERQCRMIEGDYFKNGFEPAFFENKMNEKLDEKSGGEYLDKIRENGYVWIGDLGDFSCLGKMKQSMKKIIEKIIKPYPETMFLLETKDPSVYRRFVDNLPENVMLSTTLETNRGYDYGEGYDVSNAPEPKERYEDFRVLDWDRKHISIEPLLDFDMKEFVGWIEDISPEIVWIGPDNYHANLPEPPLSKAFRLVTSLSKSTIVEPKKHMVDKMSEEWDSVKDKDKDFIYRKLSSLGLI